MAKYPVPGLKVSGGCYKKEVAGMLEFGGEGKGSRGVSAVRVL